MIPQLNELEQRLLSNQRLEPEEASLFVRELANELADLVRLTGLGAALLEEELNRHAEQPPNVVAHDRIWPFHRREAQKRNYREGSSRDVRSSGTYCATVHRKANCRRYSTRQERPD